MKELDCFGGTPIRGRSCQAQPCRHLIQAIMVWLCSTTKALRGFRMSKNLSSTFATTFSSYTVEALSSSTLCFMAFLPPFPLKGDYQGVNFLTRFLVRRVEVHMASHFLHWVQNIFLSLVLFFGVEGAFFTSETMLEPAPSLSFPCSYKLAFQLHPTQFSSNYFLHLGTPFAPIMSFPMAESSWNSASLVSFPFYLQLWFYRL